MAVIAVYSSKGGVGKTTIAANLGWCSAQLSGRRTLLWDLDPTDGAGFMFALEAQRKLAQIAPCAAA
jgi:cellulose biosynthesis protein BcsQ